MNVTKVPTFYELINTKNHNKNRFINFYLKYQIFLANITLYLLPILIIFGIIEIIYILNYLISHPLPIDQIGIDPHVFIGNKK